MSRKTQPIVDFIILSWNRAKLTAETIKNVAGQKGIIGKIWVIDQGSEKPQLKNLISEVSSIQSIRIIDLGRNMGVAGGRNFGMRQGQADYIVCIDNDAIFASDHAVLRAIERLEENPNIAVLGFKIINSSSHQIDYSSWAYARALLPRQDEEFHATRFCGAGHIIRRSMLEKTEFYDEDLFFYWEELDLSNQLINLGFEILYYPEVVILHKKTDEQKQMWSEKRFYYLVRNAIYLNWKYFRSVPNVIQLCIGYFLKGLFNNLLSTTVSGIFDSVSIIRRKRLSRQFILNKQAREYIYKYDIAPRGSTFSRIQNEVFSKLPMI